MIYLDIPDDDELLAAFGALALRHEQMNYIIKMTIKTLLGVSVEEARDATRRETARGLRQRVKANARKVLGEGEPLIRMQAILERCGKLTEKRNYFLHSLCAKELDGEYRFLGEDHSWESFPTVEELKMLAEEMKLLTSELNEARLHGFLHEALQSVRADAT